MITNWSEINVEQYREINDLKYVDEDDYHIQLLSILKDVSIDDLEDLSIGEYNGLLGTATFVSSPPKGLPKDKLELKDDIVLYKINNSSLSIGAFVDIENLLMDGLVKNFCVILSIFYRLKIKEATLLEVEKLEDYGDWIFHRAELFNEVPIQYVYGTITHYLKYRAMIFKTYSGLFNSQEELEEDDEYVEIIEDETGIQKRERLKAEATDSSIKKWGWDTMILKLAGGDVLKLNEVSDIPLIQGFNVLSIQKELDI
jgi:hypothetical protein